MAEKILLLHEKALRYRFDFDQTSNDFKAIHIWDDAYYRMQRYSFKRLVFIYETLLPAIVTNVPEALLKLVDPEPSV